MHCTNTIMTYTIPHSHLVDIPAEKLMQHLFKVKSETTHKNIYMYNVLMQQQSWSI